MSILPCRDDLPDSKVMHIRIFAYKNQEEFMLNFLNKLVSRHLSKKENSVPFYVSSEGALFAKAEEVINTKVVRDQLEDFVRLQNSMIDKQNSANCQP